MRRPREAEERLEADLRRIADDHVVVIELESIEHLLVAPDRNPFEVQRGPSSAGLDDLGLTLASVPGLPDRLTVRAVLPAGATPSMPLERAQAAMRTAAAERSTVAWREGMAVRSMGRRQTPIGIAIAFVSALVAYLFWFLLSEAESNWWKVVAALLGGIFITIAWLVSWMVIEFAMVDWRLSGRKAAVYALLAEATLEVTTA